MESCTPATQGIDPPSVHTISPQSKLGYANTPTLTLTTHAASQANCHHTDQVPEAPVPQTYLIPTQVRTVHSQITYPPINGLKPAEAQTPLHDNYYIGDSLQLPKEARITSLYFQNLNGINLSAPGNWDETCSHLRDMEVDIALIAEHKLNTTQP